MVRAVVDNMNYAVETNSNVRNNIVKDTDSSFEKILNQEANVNSKVEENNVEKNNVEKTTNTKLVNGKKHNVKTSNSDTKIHDEPSKDTGDNIDQLEEEITNELIDTLNITAEQLDEILTQLNMNVFDLLISDNLNTFLTALYQVDDSLELLTMPDVTSNIKELKTGLNELLEEYNLDTDDIQEIISNLELKDAEIKTETKVDTEVSNNINDSNVTSMVTDETETSEKLTQSSEFNDTTNDDSPEIEIEDNRTEVNSTVKDESNTEVTSGDNKGILDNVQNITINNSQTKVEIIDGSGQKQILTYNISTDEIIDQIVSSFKVNLTDDVDTVFIQLRPEHLGKLAFSLTSQEGVVTANFVAENGAVKELIENNLTSLKMTLEEQGMIVDKLEVVVNDNSMSSDSKSFNQSNHNNNKKRRAAKMMKVENIEDEINEILENESIISQLEDVSSIDYSV